MFKIKDYNNKELATLIRTYNRVVTNENKIAYNAFSTMRNFITLEADDDDISLVCPYIEIPACDTVLGITFILDLDWQHLRYVSKYVVDYCKGAVLLDGIILFYFCENKYSNNFDADLVPVLTSVSRDKTIIRIINRFLFFRSELAASVKHNFGCLDIPFYPKNFHELHFYVKAMRANFSNEHAAECGACVTDYAGRLWREALANAEYFNDFNNGVA